jgi:hypothetical protein
MPVRLSIVVWTPLLLGSSISRAFVPSRVISHSAPKHQPYRLYVKNEFQAKDYDYTNDDDDDDDDDDFDEDEEDNDMWMEQYILSSIFGGDDFMAEGPDAFLSDDDLSLLHNITIPSLQDNGEQQHRPKPTTRTVMSLEDLKKLSSSGLSYFYLRDEIGLSEDAMWKITNNAGSALGMKASTIREKIEVLRNTMQLSDDNVRTLISAQPTLLHLSAKKNIAPTILFLVRQLGLGVQELRTLVLGCPSVLNYAIPNLNRKLEFFIDTLGYSVKECREILLEAPRLLTCGVETGLMPRLNFLLKEINIPVPKLRLIIQKNPRILQMSVDQNLQPKLIFYLIMTLHMDPSQVQRLLLRCPKVLDFNLEDHTLPITRYFLSLDFSAHEFARMCLKFPPLLTYSLAKMKHVVGYLRFELGLEASMTRRVLYQAPQIVSLSMSNLESKVEFLKDAVGANDTATLRKVIVGMPTLLYLSIEKNLGPKVSYLREQLGEEEFRLAVARMPALLAYSLDKRIKPRMDQISEAGVDATSITIGISMKEAAFDSWLEGRARKAALGTTVTTGKRMTKSTPRPSLAEEPADTREANEAIVTKEKEGDKAEEVDEGNKVVENGGRIVHWVRRS